MTVPYIESRTSSVRCIPARALVARPACLDDAAAIARIYNQGILARTSTFETEPRTAQQIEALLIERGHTYPTIVVERAGRVVGWAGSSPHSMRPCFSGVAEFSIYVEQASRATGVGRVALEALVDECERRGFWKLLSRVFPENTASRLLCRALGFREAGLLRCHAPVDGIWRDAVIVEKLLGEARSVNDRAARRDRMHVDTTAAPTGPQAPAGTTIGRRASRASEAH
jgi:L-amino acid N-acyltransferase YncA